MDKISELPADILSLIVALLTMKEAARTSILSRRWRFIWKLSVSSSLSLSLDVLDCLSIYKDNSELGDCLAVKFRRGLVRTMSSRGRKKFAGYVLQMLHLDHDSVRDSFKLQFYLEKDFPRHRCQWISVAILLMKEFALHIDHWIKLAIAKKCQSFELDSSHFVINREIYYDRNLYYQLPSLFSSQKIRSPVRSFSLKPCSVRSLECHGYSLLKELQLKFIFVEKHTILSILTNCCNLEKLCLSHCEGLLSLKVSGPSLALKHLIVLFCGDLKKIKINAKELTSFQYYGNWVKFVPTNVLHLSDLVLGPQCNDSHGILSYAHGTLSRDAPRLESLMLSVVSTEEKKLPRLLPLFNNLKKLVLLVSKRVGTLWGFMHLLQASPCLCKLELHVEDFDLKCWPVSLEREVGSMERPSDFFHHCLEEILLTGFRGDAHEIEIVTYLLNNALALKSLTIFSKFLFYAPGCPSLLRTPRGRGTVEEIVAAATRGKKMKGGVWEQVDKLVRPGTEFLFVDWTTS